MQTKTIAALAMVLSFSAQAEWERIGKSSDGITSYLDYATIKKTRNGYRAWTLYDQSTRDKYGDLSAVMLDEYDCKEERTRILQFRSFYGHMGTEGIHSVQDATGQWSYPMPETTGETLLKAVCRAGK